MHKLIFMMAVLIIVFPQTSIAQSAMDMISHGDFKPDAVDSSIVQEWEAARKNGGEKEEELVKDILTIADKGQVLASLNWLRDIIKGGETDYVYPFMYARQLHRTKFVSHSADAELTARAMSYYAKLLLLTDAARCDDNGVGASRMYSLSKELSVVEKGTDALPDNIKMIAMDIALFMEEKNKDREKQPLICQSGIKFMSRAMESSKTLTSETIAKEDNYYGHIPGSKVVSVEPGEDVKVFYISDEVWGEKRNKIRESMREAIRKNR